MPRKSTRIFGGKGYRYYNQYSSPSRAQVESAELKAMGWNVRIIEQSDPQPYVLFIRRRKKRKERR